MKKYYKNMKIKFEIEIREKEEEGRIDNKLIIKLIGIII
jgi:hypothetical protein